MNETISGRDLDKAVAVALGYTVVRIDYPWGGVEFRLRRPNGEYYMFTRKDESEAWKDVPRFSTAINLFGTLLEHFRKQGWGYSSKRPIGSDIFTFTILNGDEEVARATSTDPNEAACRAFLAAHEATQAH